MMLGKKPFSFFIFHFLFSILILASCTTIDLYERVVAIPDHAWDASFKPEFKFQINDTTVAYQLYVVLRHNDKYNWNNVWINLYTKSPSDTLQRIQYELPLANKDRWLGTAMGDVYEHRVLITPQPIYFRKRGEYIYTIEQIMRENPLENVLNVGLRIEKKQ